MINLYKFNIKCVSAGKPKIRRKIANYNFYFNDLIKFGQMSLYFLAIIGLLYPFLDKHLDEPYRYQGEWSSVMRCVAVFVGINHASAVSFKILKMLLFMTILNGLFIDLSHVEFMFSSLQSTGFEKELCGR